MSRQEELIAANEQHKRNVLAVLAAHNASISAKPVVHEPLDLKTTDTGFTQDPKDAEPKPPAEGDVLFDLGLAAVGAPPPINGAIALSDLREDQNGFQRQDPNAITPARVNHHVNYTRGSFTRETPQPKPSAPSI